VSCHSVLSSNSHDSFMTAIDRRKWLPVESIANCRPQCRLQKNPTGFALAFSGGGERVTMGFVPEINL